MCVSEKKDPSFSSKVIPEIVLDNVIVAKPTLIGDDTSKITKDYVRNSSLLINLAKAIGRIVVSYKDVQSLAGYTTLIYEMKEVLDDLEQGKYKRSMVKTTDIDGNNQDESKEE